MKYRLLLLSSLLLGAGAARAEPTPAPSLAEAQQSLVEAALASDYAWRQTAALADGIGQRLSGSPGAAAAVQYVAEELRRLGLEVRLEPVKVPHWRRGAEEAALVAWPQRPAGLEQRLALLTLGGSVATPTQGLVAPVVPVRDYAELERLGRAGIAGRIVLYTAAYDEALNQGGYAGNAYGGAVDYRVNGASRAAALGAVAALNRSAGWGDNRLPHTGSLKYAEGVARIPAAAVSSEDALLIERLAAQGEVRLRLKLLPQTLPDADSYNVVADLKGRERPEEVVVISGHLDSWDVGTGAQDDASGVAVAMQAAQLMKSLGLVPRRTLRVIAWMNEENGLAGAKAYAAAHAAELGQHLAAIEMDMGAGHPMGFRAQVPPQAMPMLAPLAKRLAGIGAGVVQHSLDGVGADIGPLSKAGVPGFAPLVDGRDYFRIHHTEADTLDKINPRHLAENAAVLSALAYTLAEGEALPRLPVVAP